MDGAGVPFRGQEGLIDVQFPAEVIHFVGLGFEIAISEVGQNEIKDHQPRANVLDGMLAAIAQVLTTNGSIHRAGKEIVDTPVAEEEPSGGMPLPQNLLREGHAPIAALGSREFQKLARREVPGMRGHKIEKAGFVCGVAEATEIIDTGFWELHGLDTQDSYGDLSFIANAAKAGGVFRPGIDLEAGAGLLREVSGMVVAGGKFQVHSRDFQFLSGILDTQVRETDFALD